MKPEIVFITGETSGDRHAAPVVGELCAQGFRVSAVGGEAMAAAGADLLANSVHWGAIGVPASARKVPALLVRGRLLVREVVRRAPAVIVLVDFGFFNVRMARLLRRPGGPKILYYFPPGSWRQDARDWSALAAITDCIATPFARNAEHLKASGANAHWVGHPAVDALTPSADREALREELGLPQGEPVIGLLSGSRLAERRLLGPRILDAAAIIKQELPGATFLWSSLPQTGRIEQGLHRRVDALEFVTPVGESYEILRASDMLIVATGTATLEAAAALTPMITVYDVSIAAKFLLVHVLRQAQRFYAMPNIMLGREAVPEIVPRGASETITAERMAAAALDLAGAPHRLDAMREDLAQVRQALGEPGAAKRTAALIAAMARDGSAESGNP